MALSAITASSTALSGLGLAAFYEGKKFESAFAGIKKTVEGTEAQFEALRQGILDMSERMPESAADIASVAEAAGQLGIATDNILDFTETMTMLGTATNLTADEAATALARFANITQMSPDNFDKLGATIVALGNNFATTESEIVAMATRIASTGEIVGLSETEIMALAATLSSLGIEAEAGSSAISRAMKDIEVAVKTGNGNLENYASVANMTVESFSKLWESSPVEALDAFVAGLNDVERNGASAIEILDDMDIKEIRMSNSLLALSTSNGLMTKAINLANTAWEENTALTNEATQRYETLDSKLTMLKSSAQNLGIYVYEGMELPLKSAADKGISYISQLQKAFKTDGLRGLVTEFSNIFVDILTFGAEKAPDFFKMGSDFLMSIANGIRNNSDRIFDAFVTVLMQLPDFILTNVSALFSIGSLFVDKLAQGIGENADNIGSAAADLLVKFADFLIVNIPKLASAAAQIVKAFAKEIGNQVPLLKPFTKLLGLAGTAVEKFGTEIGATIIAVMSFKKVSVVTNLIGNLGESMKTASKSTGLLKTAMSALKGPVGLVTSILSGLTVGVYSYVKSVEAANKAKMDEMLGKTARAIQEYDEKLDGLSESMDSAHESTEKQIRADDKEIEKTRELVSELGKYVDANGNVKSGYEDRVNYILNELASATGEEIGQIEDGVIPAYEDMTDAIDKALKKKEALSKIDAFKDEADAAHDVIDSYVETKRGLSENREDVESQLQEIKQSLIREYSGTPTAEAIGRTSFDKGNYEFWNQYLSSDIMGAIFNEENGLAVQLDEVNEAIKENETLVEDAMHTYENYSEAERLALAGDYEGALKKLDVMRDTNARILEDERTTQNEKKIIIQKELEEEYELFKKAVETGSKTTQKEVSERMADIIGKMGEYGIDSSDDFVVEFLAGLSGMDEFDTTKLIAYLSQTGTNGGIVAREMVLSELGVMDLTGVGSGLGQSLGLGLTEGVLPHIAAVEGLINGLQLGASTLSATIQGIALAANSINIPQGGSGGGGSTTTNNTYNGGSASGRTSAQKTAAYKNSVKGGVGGG